MTFSFRKQFQSQLYYRRKMQAKFTIPILSKDGKTLSMQVKQKVQQLSKRKVKTWTDDEDNQLLDFYEKFPKQWAQIAARLNDRNQNQCLHRYRRLVQLGKNHKIWSSEEDQNIIKLVKKYGKNWKVLSEMLGSKTGKQIRERFINKLDPKIKQQDWTVEEDHKILELYSKIGSRWSQISKSLPGRPQNKVKNRFYSYIHKNFDISFKEIEPNSQSVVIDTNPTKQAETYKEQSQQQTPNDAHSDQPIQQKEEDKKSQERRNIKFDIPSINEIQFDLRNEHLMSHNLFDSVVQIQQNWRIPINYQSIIQFQSNDLFFKYQS